MKKNISDMKKLILCLALLLPLIAQAQTPIEQQSWKNDWDYDFRAMRFNEIPSFKCPYDDYIQYAPAAALLITKACKVEGRSDWGRMLAADAFSTAILASLVSGIKYSACRLRPDESTRNSFPSGHTATAFMCATMLHKEYGSVSPWISFGGYAVASFTGVSRMMNNRHWCTDVIAGAAIGVAAVELGYLINDAIFKDKHRGARWEDPVFNEDPLLKYWSLECVYGHRWGIGSNALSGAAMLAQADLPFHPRFSVRARLGINTLRAEGSQDSGNFYDGMAGLSFNYPFAKVLCVEADALLGGGGNRSRCPEEIKAVTGRSFGEFNCGAAVGVRLGCNFKVKLLAEYNLIFPANAQSVLLGLGTAFFW